MLSGRSCPIKTAPGNFGVALETIHLHTLSKQAPEWTTFGPLYAASERLRCRICDVLATESQGEVIPKGIGP